MSKENKMRNIPYVALVAALLAQPVSAVEIKAKAAGDAAPMMTVDTNSFVKTVVSANEFEVRSSELALKTADNADLKETAKMIIADHKKAGEKLKMLLDAKTIEAPAPAELAPKHQKMMDQLNAAKGKDFDVLYLDMQAQAHMEAVGLFRTYAGSGDNQTIVGFAKETLPALETHLAHVMMLVAKE
jgi:putative membrane protein